MKNKLTPDDVRLIRELLKERDKLKRQLKPLTNASIAEKFGVTGQVINRINQRKIYRGVV